MVTGSGGTRVCCEALVRMALSLPHHLFFRDASCTTKLTTCGVVEGRSDVIVDELGVEVDGVEADCVAETEWPPRRDHSEAACRGLESKRLLYVEHTFL